MGKRKMRPVFLILAAGMVMFFGCKTLEPLPELPLPLTIPEHFSRIQTGQEPVESWWRSFGSDELNDLIQDALDNSFDLKALKSKIAQARAGVSKEEAALLPDLGFSLGGQARNTRTKKSGTPSTDEGSHSWNSSLSSSYTPDVWGEADAQIQSASLGLRAAEMDLRASTLEVAARVAGTWIDIIAARERQAILARQIQINQTLLELQKLRFANGKANALEVSQQREALAAARSQAPLLEKQERILLNSLAFLSGQTRVDQIRLTANELPDPVPLPRVGIPMDLLSNRPDIQAAGMRLSSSQWEITGARANRLPSFNLTAQALFSSGTLDLLFRNWVATLAGSIAGPIFDGGGRQAEVERTRAVAEEHLNAYARTVAGAILEVEDYLISLEKQEAYIRLLEEELEVARLTLKDAMVQYRNGQSSYLSYLIAWTGIEGLERQLTGERAGYLKEQIGLYQALGWESISETEEETRDN
jgi:NodT family efflux transporter outer membrane factor (OMF) lipoprotein